jgi:hypothetical protein
MAEPDSLQQIADAPNALRATLRESRGPVSTFLPSILATLLGFAGGVITTLVGEAVRARRTAHGIRRSLLAELRATEIGLVQKVLNFGNVPVDRLESEFRWFFERGRRPTEIYDTPQPEGLAEQLASGRVTYRQMAAMRLAQNNPVPNRIGPLPLPVVDSILGTVGVGLSDDQAASLVGFRRHIEFLNRTADDIDRLEQLTFTTFGEDHQRIGQNLEVMQKAYRERMIWALDSLRQGL